MKKTQDYELFGIPMDQEGYAKFAGEKIEIEDNGEVKGHTLKQISFYIGCRDYWEHLPEFTRKCQEIGEEAAKRIREYYGQRDGRRRYKAMRHDTFTGYLADLKAVRDDLSSTRLELLKKREADEAEYKQKRGDRSLSEYERAQALIRWKDREGYYSAQMERLKNQTAERIAAIRDSFEEHVKDFYKPNGYRIDSGTMQLLNSGIRLSDDELTGLVEANIHNPTMLRVLADHCEKAGIKNQAVMNYGMFARKSGKEELKLFDQIANVVQRATCGSDMDARVYGVESEKDNFGQILAEGIDSMEGRALKPAAVEE